MTNSELTKYRRPKLQRRLFTRPPFQHQLAVLSSSKLTLPLASHRLLQRLHLRHSTGRHRNHTITVKDMEVHLQYQHQEPSLQVSSLHSLTSHLLHSNMEAHPPFHLPSRSILRPSSHNIQRAPRIHTLHACHLRQLHRMAYRNVRTACPRPLVCRNALRSMLRMSVVSSWRVCIKEMLVLLVSTSHNSLRNSNSKLLHINTTLSAPMHRVLTI